MVRRPYVFLFRDERDYCERGLINLAQAKTEYSAEQQQIVKNTFSITTKQNVFLIQTMNEKDLYDWLYAINPLLAGKIRYVRNTENVKRVRKCPTNFFSRKLISTMHSSQQIGRDGD